MVQIIPLGENAAAKNISFPRKFPVETDIDVTLNSFDDSQDFVILKNDTIKDLLLQIINSGANALDTEIYSNNDNSNLVTPPAFNLQDWELMSNSTQSISANSTLSFITINPWVWILIRLKAPSGSTTADILGSGGQT